MDNKIKKVLETIKNKSKIKIGNRVFIYFRSKNYNEFYEYKSGKVGVLRKINDDKMRKIIEKSIKNNIEISFS